jgi:hypothetical protein
MHLAVRPCARWWGFQVEVETGFGVVEAPEVGVLWGRVTGMVGGSEVEEDVMRVAIMGVWLGRAVGGVGILTERGEVPDGSKEGGEEGLKRRKADGCYSYSHFDAARGDQLWMG